MKNLSKSIRVYNGYFHIPVKDVKEFIKRLKEEFNEVPGDHERIDKLCGEKLR